MSDFEEEFEYTSESEYDCFSESDLEPKDYIIPYVSRKCIGCRGIISWETIFPFCQGRNCPKMFRNCNLALALISPNRTYTRHRSRT